MSKNRSGKTKLPITENVTQEMIAQNYQQIKNDVLHIIEDEISILLKSRAGVTPIKGKSRKSKRSPGKPC